MDLNQQLNHRSNFLYYFTEDGSYNLIMNLAWIVGLIINIICLVTYRLGDVENTDDMAGRKLMRESWKPAIEITNFVFSGICLTSLLIWLLFRS